MILRRLGIEIRVVRYCYVIVQITPQIKNKTKYNDFEFNKKIKALQKELYSRKTKQNNTIQFNTIQHNTIQFNTIQHNTIQHNTTQQKSIQ